MVKHKVNIKDERTGGTVTVEFGIEDLAEYYAGYVEYHERRKVDKGDLIRFAEMFGLECERGLRRPAYLRMADLVEWRHNNVREKEGKQ